MLKLVLTLTVMVVLAVPAAANAFPRIPPTCTGPTCSFTGGSQVVPTQFNCRYLSFRTPVYVCTTGRLPG